MRVSFSHTMLITLVLLLVSCRSQFVQKSYQTQNIPVSAEHFNDHEKITKLLSPYKSELEADINRVISFSEVELIKDKPESLLTNFLADLLLEKGNEIGNNQKPVIKPSISYVNYGGIRAPLPKGKITVGNIFELMPFENELIFIELSGVQIKTFLDIIAKKGGDSVGGVRFVIGNESAEKIWINNEKLIEDKYYWLATNDYVANGGDDFSVFTQRNNYVETGYKIRDLIISYLENKNEKNEKLIVNLDGRIKNE